MLKQQNITILSLKKRKKADDLIPVKQAVRLELINIYRGIDKKKKLHNKNYNKNSINYSKKSN